MKYEVLGGWTQTGNIYNEELLKEFNNHADAVEYAKTQRGAWDEVIIRTDEDPDTDESIENIKPTTNAIEADGVTASNFKEQINKALEKGNHLVIDGANVVCDVDVDFSAKISGKVYEEDGPDGYTLYFDTDDCMTIRKLRRLTGLSAQKFGDKYKIPLRTIQNWEYGTNPTPEYLLLLLERAVREDFDISSSN